MLFSDKITILKTVIKLANVRRENEERFGMDSLDLSPAGHAKLEKFRLSPNYEIIKKSEEALFEYLNKLDFEDVKILQTIMYLGRDEDFEEKDSFENRYNSFRNYLDNSGWNDKKIEVNQMFEKIPLDTYLIKGASILGITY